MFKKQSFLLVCLGFFFLFYFSLASQIPLLAQTNTGGGVSLEIHDLRIDAEETVAVIRWQTNLAATGQLLWGLTPNLGQTASIACSSGNGDMSVCRQLTNLTPSTTYYFQAKASNSLAYDIAAGSFTTDMASSTSSGSGSTSGGQQEDDGHQTTDGNTLDNTNSPEDSNTDTPLAGLTDTNPMPNATDSNQTDYQAQPEPAPVTVSGQVIDEEGSVLDQLIGVVIFKTPAGEPVKYTQLKNGGYSLSIMPGIYQIKAETPPDSQWQVTSPASFTVLVLPLKQTFHIQAASKTASIRGTVFNQNSEPISRLPLRVLAHNSQGGLQQSLVDASTGTFELEVTPGVWHVKPVPVEDDKFFIPQKHATRVEVQAGQSVTQNLYMLLPDATIRGQLLRTDGQPAAQKWVSIYRPATDPSSSAGTAQWPAMSAGIFTDQEGRFEFSVPAGHYLLRAKSQADNLFNNPEEQPVTIQDEETKEVTLRFRPSDQAVQGSVWLDGTKTRALVYAWSEKGGAFHTRTDEQGDFKFNIPDGDIWRFAAVATIDQTAYKSAVQQVTLTQTDLPAISLNLERFRSIPPERVATIAAQDFAVVSSTDGAKVTTPANSLSSQGKTTLSLLADPEIPEHNQAKIVGLGYNILARNENNQIVTDLSGEITITLPYTQADLDKLRVQTKDLRLGFWDETTNAWRDLVTSVVDEASSVVSATTNHLTRFAIVAAADITPPPAPSNIKAAAAAGGTINISWTNPTSDFQHAKIYRSTLSGDMGALLATGISQSSYSDTQASLEITYYYTVRAVDPAGNESANTTQVAASAAASGPVTVTELAEKLAGQILLQVEQNGEAWYVNRETKQRYFLGRPHDAFNVMRSQGLGITNADIAKIPIGLTDLTALDSDQDGLSDIFEDAVGSNKNSADSDQDTFGDKQEIGSGYNPLGAGKTSADLTLAQNLGGKILLQVEQNGEAWYVNRETKQRYFLGRPHDAFNVMRSQGLGITNANLEQISIAPDSAPVL